MFCCVSFFASKTKTSTTALQLFMNILYEVAYQLSSFHEPSNLMQLRCLRRTFSAFCRLVNDPVCEERCRLEEGQRLSPTQSGIMTLEEVTRGVAMGSPWPGAGPYITRSHHTKRVYFTKTSKNQDQVMALLFAFPTVETTLTRIALYGGEDLGGKCQRGTQQLQVINCTAIVSATRHNISHRYRQRRLGWLHPPSRFYISQIDLG